MKKRQYTQPTAYSNLQRVSGAGASKRFRKKERDQAAAARPVNAYEEIINGKVVTITVYAAGYPSGYIPRAIQTLLG